MSIKKPKILVVGSFVMDLIVSTKRFPNSGETVLGVGYNTAPGGKGANQAVQAARLGAEVTMVGKVGKDAFGQELVESAKAAGINVERVIMTQDNISAIGNVQLEERENTTVNRIIVVPGANMSISKEDVAFLEEEIENYDMVMLQLEIPMEINILVAGYAHKKGVHVMLNSAPSAQLPDELLKCLTYISPNEHETEDLTGIHISHSASEVNMEAVKTAAAVLQAKGVENVLITLGSAGAALVENGTLHYSRAVKGVRAIDPTAAGDSFVGAFCVAICRGMSIEDSLAFANYTAALTVSKMGAMPSLPTQEEVNSILPEYLKYEV